MERSAAEFTNWSGQYKSKPAAFVSPTTPADLQQIVKDTANHPSAVVAIGSGHSNSGCNVVNGGTAVSMKGFHSIGEPNADDVTVGAGVQLFEVLPASAYSESCGRTSRTGTR